MHLIRNKSMQVFKTYMNFVSVKAYISYMKLIIHDLVLKTCALEKCLIVIKLYLCKFLEVNRE